MDESKKTIGKLISTIVGDVGELVGNLTDDATGIAGRIARDGSDIVTSTTAKTIGTSYNLVKDVSSGVVDGAKNAGNSMQDETEELVTDAKSAGEYLGSKFSEAKDALQKKANELKVKADEYQKAKAQQKPKDALSAFPADVVEKAKAAANATNSADTKIRTRAAEKILRKWENSQKKSKRKSNQKEEIKVHDRNTSQPDKPIENVEEL